MTDPPKPTSILSTAHKGPVYVPGGPDRRNDVVYYASFDELMKRCAEELVPLPPAFVAATSAPAAPDAEEFIRDQILENSFEDAYDHVPRELVEEMQTFLASWCARCGVENWHDTGVPIQVADADALRFERACDEVRCARLQASAQARHCPDDDDTMEAALAPEPTIAVEAVRGAIAWSRAHDRDLGVVLVLLGADVSGKRVALSHAVMHSPVSAEYTTGAALAKATADWRDAITGRFFDEVPLLAIDALDDDLDVAAGRRIADLLRDRSGRENTVTLVASRLDANGFYFRFVDERLSARMYLQHNLGLAPIVVVAPESALTVADLSEAECP